MRPVGRPWVAPGTIGDVWSSSNSLGPQGMACTSLRYFSLNFISSPVDMVEIGIMITLIYSCI